MRDNTALSRFELEVNGLIAFANYSREGDVLHILHVEAPQALRGTGAAGKLMQAIADYATTQHLNLNPVCGYAASWLQRHHKA